MSYVDYIKFDEWFLNCYGYLLEFVKSNKKRLYHASGSPQDISVLIQKLTKWVSSAKNPYTVSYVFSILKVIFCKAITLI